MILVDTSVWVDHFRGRKLALALAELLDAGSVFGHPWVTGELALGRLAQRQEVIALLSDLPQAVVATPEEVLRLVDQHHLVGTGIGYVDAQLLAATRLTPDAKLWTADRRLAAAAQRLGCGMEVGSG
ncbi:MAG: type II toxin-antitoxin system VapC family toxin [Mycobacteriales bacterium]